MSIKSSCTPGLYKGAFTDMLNVFLNVNIHKVIVCELATARHGVGRYECHIHHYSKYSLKLIYQELFVALQQVSQQGELLRQSPFRD